MIRLLTLALINALLSLTSFDLVATGPAAKAPRQRSIYANYRRHHYEPLLSFDGGHVHLRHG